MRITTNQDNNDKEIFLMELFIQNEPRNKFKKCTNLQIKEGLETKPCLAEL